MAAGRNAAGDPASVEIAQHGPGHEPTGRLNAVGFRSTNEEFLQHGTQHRCVDVVRLVVQDDGARVRSSREDGD